MYFDDLLKELKESGIGCYMHVMFTGAFIYVDDITLLDLSYMLAICNKYALLHDITFGPTKSKCMMFCKCIKTYTPYSVFLRVNLSIL